jgi:DNA-binding FadR family transcriptional regulator
LHEDFAVVNMHSESDLRPIYIGIGMRRQDRAIEKLDALLASGHFPVNSRLPPERQLTEDLELSRSALREGLEVLEARGRIWRHVGRGTFVGNRPLDTPASLSVITSQTSPTEVLEVRLLIEPMLARLAGLRATDADIGHMEHLLERSEAARDPKTWELWDGRLHRMVAEAAHNRLLLSLFDAFNAMRSQKTWGQLRQTALTPERREIYCRHHRAYVSAIARRDPRRAEELMRRHIEAVRADLLEAVHGAG